MDKKPTIAIVILAAGSASRMGKRIKQLLPWKGTTLLGNAMEQATLSDADSMYVVLGAHYETIIKRISFEKMTVLQNHHWQKGLGSSITTAMQFFLSQGKKYDATLIMLADQPFITANHINTMLKAWKANTDAIVTTQYKNRSGVPAIFGAAYYQELQQLNKDFGAKDIIRKYQNKVLPLTPKAGSVLDIDTWEDYQKLLKAGENEE